MEKLYTGTSKMIFENGRWEDALSSLYPPGSASGHKLQKPSKGSGIFQSLGSINCSFLLKNGVKWGKGAWRNAPPKYAPAMGNAKIFPQLMFKSRGLAKISERRLQPLLV